MDKKQSEEKKLQGMTRLQQLSYLKQKSTNLKSKAKLKTLTLKSKDYRSTRINLKDPCPCDSGLLFKNCCRNKSKLRDNG